LISLLQDQTLTILYMFQEKGYYQLEYLLMTYDLRFQKEPSNLSPIPKLGALLPNALGNV